MILENNYEKDDAALLDEISGRVNNMSTTRKAAVFGAEPTSLGLFRPFISLTLQLKASRSG